jgi:acyl carrier protein
MKPTLQEITEWIKNKLVETIQVTPDVISFDKDFLEYGLDSLNAVSFVGEIEQWLDLDLPTTTLWDHSTVNNLAAYLDKELQQAAIK